MHQCHFQIRQQMKCQHIKTTKQINTIIIKMKIPHQQPQQELQFLHKEQTMHKQLQKNMNHKPQPQRHQRQRPELQIKMLEVSEKREMNRNQRGINMFV